MSEYYDHYHRWEPLAEFHFNLDSDDVDYDKENYLYCLCSRAFIRDSVKFYYVDKEASESDAEGPKDNQSQPGDDHSHVHFSIDTSYKVKCEKDDGASCYCSASHTENCCSTDEHDGVQIHGTSHALQPSDSGADLTYQDCHSDNTNHDKRMDQHVTETEENYLSENTWDKFWAVNGERLIWASWIKKYSDYINPQYLDENNDLLLDDNKLPKQRSVDQICSEFDKAEDDSIRERKFSYDSKVNPYKKAPVQDEKQDINECKDESWLPVNRRRSCSEHERIVSPRTIEGTDSMTNVTKITMSSYDITSSHITSESTPTDDFSVSSTTSDDQSNDQTRIANIENLDPDNIDEMDTDQYWQFLWKKHFGDQYALHYANYLEMINKQNVPAINVSSITEETDLKEAPGKDVIRDIVLETALDIDCENSDGLSQEMPTVVEVQKVVQRVEQIEISEAPMEEKQRNRKKNKKSTNKYLGSVGVLLNNLLKEEQVKSSNEADFTNTEVTEAGDSNTQKAEKDVSATTTTHSIHNTQTVGNNSLTSYSYDDGDDDPPVETPITLKRSHEIDHESNVAEKIKSTFDLMGFRVNDTPLPKGNMVYRKRIKQLRLPRYKKFGARKTYFDEDGNTVQDQDTDSQDEREMQTDEDCPDFRTQATKLLKTLEQPENDNHSKDKLNTGYMSADNLKNDSLDDSVSYDVQNKCESVKEGEDNCLAEASEVALPDDAEFSDKRTEPTVENLATNTESAQRRRRQKRQARTQEYVLASMPEELRDDPKMLKYWKKRHSLFHRFDEGIRLDRESWFSVTPENVARHIACKYTYDTVLDAFCGAGGNTLQFAFTSKKVIAIDIDPVKIEMARHNATVYGVADRIEFIVGDFFELAPTLKADMVFLSPPWGGPEYSNNIEYNIETMLQPKPASELMSTARTISPTVYLYLPRNSKPDQILALAKEVGGSVEIEQSFLDRRFVAITAYFY